MFRKISLAILTFVLSAAAVSAQSSSPDEGGVVVSKVAKNNYDGTYTINIEAFVTGTQFTTSSLVSTPVDAVLVLDYSYSMTYKISTGRPTGSGPTRLQALHTAVEQFLKTMKANQDAYNAIQTDDSKKITHRVSIVTFNKTATTRYTLANGSLDTDTKVTNIINAVKGWTTDYYTRSDLGIQKGYDELSNVRAGATPIMVFFTDGEPTSSSGSEFYEPTATAAIKCAYNVKLAKGETGLTLGGKSYKGLGAPVYAVSVIDAKGDMGTFLNNVSSNYPSATSMTSSGTRNTSSTNYLMVAPDEDALETAFVSIARDISSGGASIELDSETITADIVMSDFQISKTFGSLTSDAIDVYVKPLTAISGSNDDVYTWGTKTQDSNLRVNVTDDPSTGNHIVKVSGFDFSNHWCGFNYVNGVKNGLHDGGQKLCLDIQLVPNLDKAGGLVATNDPISGLYLEDGTTGLGTQLASFGASPVVYAPCDIIVERVGLKPGESVIYQMTRNLADGQPDVDYEPVTVVVTADENGIARAVVKGDATYLSDPSDEDSVAFYNYIVKEVPSDENGRWDWSYEYDPDALIQSHALYTEGQLDNEFIFGDPGRKELDENTYDEAARKNVFRKLNTN